MLGCELETSGLGLFTPFDFILHGFSDGYIYADSFNSFTFPGLHEGDSVSNRSDDGSISSLVCKLCV